MAVKARLLELIAEATGAGWSFRKACGVLGLGERRARYWQQRAAAGALADRKPGGTRPAGHVTGFARPTRPRVRRLL